MKKLLWLICSMVLAFALFGCGSQGKTNHGTSSHAKKGNASGGSASTVTVNVGTNPTFPPFETTQGNQLLGFDIDLMKEIGKQENLNIQFKSLPFDGLISALKTDQIDAAISGMTITKQRMQNVDFSDAYYKSGLSILVNKGSSLNGFADLKGHLIATQKGTSSVTYLKQHGISDNDIKQYDNINSAYSALINGGADAVIYDNPVNISFEKGHSAKVKIVGQLLTGEYYGIAVNKNKKDLLQKLNNGLKKIKADGEYKKLFDKYFNGDTRGLVKQSITPQKAAVTS